MCPCPLAVSRWRAAGLRVHEVLRRPRVQADPTAYEAQDAEAPESEPSQRVPEKNTTSASSGYDATLMHAHTGDCPPRGNPLMLSMLSGYNRDVVSESCAVQHSKAQKVTHVYGLDAANIHESSR